MKVTMMLADFAQAVNGKLYIMGGGWSVTGPAPTPSALAIKVEVPWNETNRKHKMIVALLDSDYRPVMVPTPDGRAPLEIAGDFEVGRPPGIPAGVPIDVPMAFNIGPIPFPSAGRYIWKLTINGKTDDQWQVAFSAAVAPAAG